MKTQLFNGLKNSLWGMNRSCSQTATAKECLPNTGGSSHLVSPVSCATTEMERSGYGSSNHSSGYGNDPEDDFTGLDAEWLYKEGSRYYFLTMMFCVLAAHLSFATYWAAKNEMYPHAVLVAALATIFWGKVVKHFRLAGRFIAAGDENLESEKPSN